MAAFVTTLFASTAAAGVGTGAATLSGGALAAAGGSGAAAAAAASAGAASLAGGLSTSSILSAAFTGVTGLMQIGQGFAQAKSLRQQAGDEMLRAQQEETRGAQRALALQQDLTDTIARQRIAFLSNGIDISGGTPQAVAQASQEEGTRQLRVVREDARNAAAIRRRSARALMSDANASILGGFVSAGGTFATGFSRFN